MNMSWLKSKANVHSIGSFARLAVLAVSGFLFVVLPSRREARQVDVQQAEEAANTSASEAIPDSALNIRALRGTIDLGSGATCQWHVSLHPPVRAIKPTKHFAAGDVVQPVVTHGFVRAPDGSRLSSFHEIKYEALGSRRPFARKVTRGHNRSEEGAAVEPGSFEAPCTFSISIGLREGVADWLHVTSTEQLTATGTYEPLPPLTSEDEAK